MDKLSDVEMLIIEYCEKIGLCIEETTLMLLIFEDATNKQKRKILNELEYVVDKDDLVDVFVDNTSNYRK